MSSKPTKIVDPVMSELPAILATIPPDRPIVMLNLLRYNAEADYRNGESPCSGREAYARYAAVALKKVQEVGGSPIYIGGVAAHVIAAKEEHWDEVLLVRYPSVKAFITMISMPDYQAATPHRTAALAEARLIATIER